MVVEVEGEEEDDEIEGGGEKVSALFRSISGSSIRHRDLFWTIPDSQSPSRSIIGDAGQWGGSGLSLSLSPFLFIIYSCYNSF